MSSQFLHQGTDRPSRHRRRTARLPCFPGAAAMCSQSCNGGFEESPLGSEQSAGKVLLLNKSNNLVFGHARYAAASARVNTSASIGCSCRRRRDWLGRSSSAASFVIWVIMCSPSFRSAIGRYRCMIPSACQSGSKFDPSLVSRHELVLIAVQSSSRKSATGLPAPAPGRTGSWSRPASSGRRAARRRRRSTAPSSCRRRRPGECGPGPSGRGSSCRPSTIAACSRPPRP